MVLDSFTTESLSKILNVNVETVRRWHRDGKLNSCSGNSQTGYIYSYDEVERFVKETKYLPAFRAYCLSAENGIGVTEFRNNWNWLQRKIIQEQIEVLETKNRIINERIDSLKKELENLGTTEKQVLGATEKQMAEEDLKTAKKDWEALKAGDR